MILRRVGNKKDIASKIEPYFPFHKIYYEPFFGVGGMYFNKRPAPYSIVNDLDQDIFNLFIVIKDNKDELIELLTHTPLHEQLFYHWKVNQETEPIKKALRFLFLSSFSYLGKKDTFHLLHSVRTYIVCLL